MLQNTTIVQNTTTPTITVHPFAVLAGYTGASDTTYEDMKTLITSTTFVATVKAKLKPEYLGSATFLAVQPLRSKVTARPTIPVMATTKMDPTVTSTGATIPFTINNQAGFAFVVVGDRYALAPNLDQVRLGVTGNGTTPVIATA